jgi:hypothetical protein
VRLVPARLAHLVAPPAPDVVRASAGRLLLPSEATAQALAETRAAGLALLAARGELVFHGAEVEAGELVGGVGEVEGLVVHSPPVRVREDGVGLLEERELLRAPASQVRVAVLR